MGVLRLFPREGKIFQGRPEGAKTYMLPKKMFKNTLFSFKKV